MWPQIGASLGVTFRIVVVIVPRAFAQSTATRRCFRQWFCLVARPRKLDDRPVWVHRKKVLEKSDIASDALNLRLPAPPIIPNNEPGAAPAMALKALIMCDWSTKPQSPATCVQSAPRRAIAIALPSRATFANCLGPVPTDASKRRNN